MDIQKLHYRRDHLEEESDSDNVDSNDDDSDYDHHGDDWDSANDGSDGNATFSRSFVGLILVALFCFFSISHFFLFCFPQK